jgi:protein-disulfide isomerase
VKRFVWLLLAGCATAPVVKTVDDGPSPIVAKFGDRSIRQSEVDAKVKDELSKLQDQMYELRSEAAEQLAIELIIADKAKAAGQSEDQWLALNVENGIPEPTDEQIQKLYEKARGRIPPGMTYEEVKPQLAQAVKREARGKRAREVFTKLKAEAGYTLLMKAPEKPRKAVDASGPSRGPADAKIVIVEFADFECPYCSRGLEAVNDVLKTYEGKVRFVFKHYPLSFHPKAPRAAAAAVCANEQGKFWEMHDALFESGELDEDALKMQAKNIGVDEKKFDVCLSSERAQAVVKKDLAAGQAAGVDGTPAFFINGIMLSGARPAADFARIIDAELSRLGN